MPRYDNDNLKKMETLPLPPGKVYSEKEEKFLREVGEYTFQNLENSGLSISFPYGGGKGHVNLLLMHGAKYKLPRFLARHVEDSSTINYSYKTNHDGTRELVETGRRPRFQMRQVF